MRSLMRPVAGLADTGKTTGKRPQRRGLVAATAAVGLLAAACGAADDAAEQTADAGSGEQAAPDGPQFDATVFSGEALTVSGDAFDLGSLADKDLVLWFWAPW